MRGDQKLFLSIFDFTDFWKLSWATHKTILNETGINMDQTEKKTCCFSSQNFIFFFEKTCGFTTGKFRMKKYKKVGSKILWSFVLKAGEGSPMSNIIVGYYFDIKKNIRRVWSISGHCVQSTAGYFFGKCPKFRSK